MKFMLIVLFSIFSQTVFGAYIAHNNQNNENDDFSVNQSKAIVPLNASWYVIRDDDYINGNYNGGNISVCEKKDGFFSKCKSYKTYTLEQYVQTKIGKKKILGMTPNFDRGGNFAFMTIYYIK